MSCPYFDPVEPRREDSGPRHAMLPLGNSWSGICRAIPSQPAHPDNAALQSCCNLGYARDNCGRFPDASGPDAVRFTITSDDGATFRLYYVLERNHEPLAHGALEYSVAAGELAPAAEGVLTGRQARAYIESYMRRKSGL
jgi:hypothetical protein